MDRLPVAHSGPILTLDWSNAAASTGSQRRDSVSDDGNLTVSGGSSAPSGGWTVSGGLDRAVKVRCLTTRSPLWNIKMNVFLLGLGRIPLARSPQTNLHTSPLLSHPTRPLAPRIRMRTRYRLD